MHYAIVALFFSLIQKCTHTTLRGSERSDLRGKGDASDVGVHEKKVSCGICHGRRGFDVHARHCEQYSYLRMWAL